MPTDLSRDADLLRQALADRGLSHLRVTKRGKSLTILSGAHDAPEARLTLVAPGSWRLDLPDHRDRWEATPFEGALDEMVDAALSIGRLDDDDSPSTGNWGDTYDPSH
jgi:hypothetical protein